MRSNIFCSSRLSVPALLLAVFGLFPSGSRAADASSDKEARATRLAMRLKVSAEAMAKLDDRQKLAVGDQVSFKIAEDREESKRLVVSDAGEIEVPYIGRHKVNEKTCAQAALEIKLRLEKEYYFCATPLLSIDVARSRGKVLVSGAVNKPDSIDIPPDDQFTVTKAILKAGGFQEPFANKEEVLLSRRLPDGSKTNFLINVQEILEKGRAEKDVPVQADDMIYIRRKRWNF